MAQEFDGTLKLDQTGFAYSTSAGPMQITVFPRYAYHATEPPRVINSQEEFEALGEGWSLQYIEKSYPKIKFSTSGDTVIVNNPEEEAALEGTWTDTPTDPSSPIDQVTRGGSFTLQQKAEAIRDSRRLSLDYVALNQSLDCHADNAPMRAISPQDVPRPQIKPTETAEQVKQRREEDEKRRKREAKDQKEENRENR